MISMPKLQELAPLELSKCPTVGSILEAMSKTPVGSGMLGRLAIDLRQLIIEENSPVAVCGWPPFSNIGQTVRKMAHEGWFSGVMTPDEYTYLHGRESVPVVFGRFSELEEQALFSRSERAFFVNPWGFAPKRQVQDGCFKDVVMADPEFVIPLLEAAFEEWFYGKPQPINDQFIEYIGQFGGTAKEFSKAARVLKSMTDDPECMVVFTMTGVVTVAQMSPIICDLIDSGKVRIIVTTGALLGHGLVWSINLPHYRHDPRFDDAALAKLRLNRVTDAIEPETNLDHVENVIHKVLKDLPEDAVFSSSEINRLIGEHLRNHYPDQRGVLRSAADKDVPVIIPAFFDSELGNDIITFNRRRKLEGKRPVTVNLEPDSDLLIDRLTSAKRRGIFTLGGGPPRNTPQNVGPLVEIMNERLGLNLTVPMYHYGCRICPDPIWLGHLGGCTYSEGVSWRKFYPDAQLAEARMDAMHAFPFLAKYVLSK